MSGIFTAVNTIAIYVIPLPFVWLLIDYGLVRTFTKRKDGSRKYDPFWWTGSGWMFFLISLSISMSAIRNYLDLFLGTNYGGRDEIRGLSFIVSMTTAAMMLIVYLIEKRQAWTVMAPRRISEEQRNLVQDLETLRRLRAEGLWPPPAQLDGLHTRPVPIVDDTPSGDSEKT